MSVKITNVSYIVSGRTLLDEIDLTAEAGQLVAIVGPNGAGKTTLMRIIAGDIAPSSGEARVNGRDPKNTTLQEMSKLRSKRPILLMEYPGFLQRQRKMFPTI